MASRILEDKICVLGLGLGLGLDGPVLGLGLGLVGAGLGLGLGLRILALTTSLQGCNIPPRTKRFAAIKGYRRFQYTGPVHSKHINSSDQGRRHGDVWGCSNTPTCCQGHPCDSSKSVEKIFKGGGGG